MKEGTVKFFNTEKGFGFIKTNNGQDIFVHSTGLIDEINEGDQVQFKTQEGNRGPSAVNVQVI